MSDKTYAQLTTQADVQDSDLIAIWRASPLKTITAVLLKAYYLTGALLIDGTNAMTAAFQAYVGSEGSPGITFDGDEDTGLYRKGANAVGLVAGGVERASWDANGITTTGLTTTGNTVLGDAAADTAVMNAKSITRPNAPAFQGKLSADVNNVTGDDTTYAIVWDVEAVDRGGDFNTSTGVFTAPFTGLYQFDAFVTLKGVDAGHTKFEIKLTTSAFVYYKECGDLAPDGSGRVGMSISILAPMTAAHTARIEIDVAGGAKTVDVVADVTGSGTDPGSAFSGYLVG